MKDNSMLDCQNFEVENAQSPQIPTEYFDAVKDLSAEALEAIAMEIVRYEETGLLQGSVLSVLQPLKKKRRTMERVRPRIVYFE